MKTFANPTKQRASSHRRPIPRIARIPDFVRTVQRVDVREILHGPRIQAKLTVGTPNDAYECEADRVAEAVMRMPEPQVRVQRVCKECEEEVQRQPVEEVEEAKLQTKRLVGAGGVVAVERDLETRIRGLRGSGQPLPESTRAFFEPRIGQDFGAVRVHTDSRSADLARSVNARAFTVGREVVFDAGEFAPKTNRGKRLIAHELTHVVQQKDSAGDPSLHRQPKPTAPTSAPSCTPRTGRTEYGCFCGAGSSCPGLDCTPSNEIDACCRQHDLDYGSCNYLDRLKPWGPCPDIIRDADNQFCACLDRLQGRFDGDSEVYRRRARRIFC